MEVVRLLDIRHIADPKHPVLTNHLSWKLMVQELATNGAHLSESPTNCSTTISLSQETYIVPLCRRLSPTTSQVTPVCKIVPCRAYLHPTMVQSDNICPGLQP